MNFSAANSTDSSIPDFTNERNIKTNNREQIAQALGIGSKERISKLNFTNPEHLAEVFRIKNQNQEIMNRPSLSEKISAFYFRRNQIIKEGIEKGEIQYIANRKDYTKQDAMSQLGIPRNSYTYKLQLAGCKPDDYIVPGKKTETKIDILKYIKPDINAQCRVTITKAILEHKKIKLQSTAQIKERCVANFDEIIIPTLQSGQALKELSDGDQQETSRMVKLYDPNGELICRLLIQHGLQKITVKNHKYDNDNIHISCHKNHDSLIQAISNQSEKIEQQITRCTNMLQILPDTIDKLKECYRGKLKGCKNEIIEASEQFTGKTIADSAVQQGVSNISRNHARRDRLVIRSIRRRLIEQIEKAKSVLEKNNLHIRSVNNSD